MAARRPVLSVLAVALALALTCGGPAAFAGVRPAVGRQARTIARAGDEYEIFVTQPTVGERTRMTVTPETTVESIITESRKLLGFDQAWLPDSDFKIYKKGDESEAITGKMANHKLTHWGPDGTELHLMFEPAE